MIDHLVYATPDLALGVQAIHKLLGVEPSPGGVHPNWGTRNALLSLGEDVYLEIIGPDPERKDFVGDRPYGISAITEPRLATWVAKAPNIEAQAEKARAAGYDPGPVTPGKRQRPDGVMLEWKLTPAQFEKGDGLVPFLIDWGTTPHPAKSAAKGGRFVRLRAEHPAPSQVTFMLNALGIALEVVKGTHPLLVATIDTASGPVELR